MTDLAQKSMVVVERTSDVTRYRLLESMIEYANNRVRDADHDESIPRRHYGFYKTELSLRTVELARDSPPARPEWDKWVRVEFENLRLALMWARTNADDLGLSMAIDFSWFARPDQALDLLAELLDQAPVSLTLRAKALRRICGIAARQGNFDEAIRYGELAVSSGRELDEPHELAYSLLLLGQSRQGRGEFEAATRALQEAASLASGNQFLASRIRSATAELACQSGHFREAAGLLLEDIEFYRLEERRLALAHSLVMLGWAQSCIGQVAAASESFRSSMSILRAFKERFLTFHAFIGLAHAASLQRNDQRAVRLGGVVDRLAREWGFASEPWILTRFVDSQLESRSRITAAKYERALKVGLAMSLDDALDYSLQAGESDASSNFRPLSIRELDVVRLVTKGLTNREIAARLSIAERTAEAHVEHIRNKLRMRSRAEVAAWAVDRGLATPV
ncbi:MAG: LuxR C-terminal-related transcriptional regulator [Candidatus Dormibacteraceae bacterium]